MKLISLRPGYVLVKVDKPEEKKNGVFIQEEWKTLPPTGVIEMVGGGSMFQVGDHVFFLRFTAIETPLGKDMRLCKESAILAVLEG